MANVPGNSDTSFTPLFDKVGCFTDVHLGLKSNSSVHLDDCLRFVDWFIEECRARGVKKGIFLGDFHHSRHNLNVSTLNVSILVFKKLSDYFDEFWFIVGNHDLFYRDKRDLNSVEFARDFPNIHIVDRHFVEGGVAILPWLVSDEWKKVQNYDVKYVFGHFELPYFKMNAMVEMPDHGGLNATMFTKPDYVFSGHFHKRQAKGNVHYIGNCFPHNYADVDDVERGAMFLEWGGDPVYVNWPDCPKYKVVNLSDLIDRHSEILDQYTHCRIKIDIPISYEEANFIRENFSAQYSPRELQLIPIKEQADDMEGVDINFESVDQTVLNQLDTIESSTIDKQLLVKIYQEIEA
jgi:DNA repair exonuclease SbcCD nuclease subunit